MINKELRPSRCAIKSKKDADEFFDIVLKATLAFKEKVNPKLQPRERATRLTPKATMVLTAIKSFGSQDERKALAEMFSVVLGEDLSAFIKPALQQEDITFDMWACIVPLTCNNSHDYTLGEPTVCDYACTCLKSNGYNGNLMDSRTSAFRVAEENEIVEFVKALASKFKVSWDR